MIDSEKNIGKFKLNRRQLIVGAIGGLASLAACNKKPGSEGTFSGDSYVLRLDAGGIPVDYVVDNNPVGLDYKTLKGLQAEALTAKEYRLACISTVEIDSPERKTDILRGLPEDVLTEEELDERGVKIINNVGSVAGLYFRRAAFSEAMPLAAYSRENPVEIVFLDGPAVNTKYLPAGMEKYAEMLSLHEEVSRVAWLQHPANQFVLTEDSLRKAAYYSLKSFEADNNHFKRIREQREQGELPIYDALGRSLLLSQIELELAQQGYYLDEEMISMRNLGLVTRALRLTPQKDNVDKNYLFISARGTGRPLSIRALYCDYTNRGMFKVLTYNSQALSSRVVLTPKPADSRPDFNLESLTLPSKQTLGSILVSALMYTDVSPEDVVLTRLAEGSTRAYDSVLKYYQEAGKKGYSVLFALPDGGYIET